MATREQGTWTRLEVDERRRQLISVGGKLFSDRSFDDISIEVGSGIKSEGVTSGAERRAKQQGWNEPMRVMGRGGRAIGRAGEDG